MIGSLFSGVAGLELGLERAGLGPVAFQVEKDPYCLHILARHYPDVPRFTDVRTVTALPYVDVLCGGFPCQQLSAAGKGEGIGTREQPTERSGLWWEFDRIIGLVRPRWVVIENVAHTWRRWVPVVRRCLYERGYTSVPVRVRAVDVGARHERARIFLVAALDPADAFRVAERVKRGWTGRGRAEAGEFGADVADVERGDGLERGLLGAPEYGSDGEAPVREHPPDVDELGLSRDGRADPSEDRGGRAPNERSPAPKHTSDVDDRGELQPEGRELGERGRADYGIEPDPTDPSRLRLEQSGLDWQECPGRPDAPGVPTLVEQWREMLEQEVQRLARERGWIAPGVSTPDPGSELGAERRRLGHVLDPREGEPAPGRPGSDPSAVSPGFGLPPRPWMVRGLHGLPGGLDGPWAAAGWTGARLREARIRALGNSVVSQCSEEIGRLIADVERSKAC